MLGVGEPTGGLVVTRVKKSDRSTRLPHRARTAPVAAREGRSILRLDSFLTTSQYQLDVYVEVCLKPLE